MNIYYYKLKHPWNNYSTLRGTTPSNKNKIAKSLKGIGVVRPLVNHEAFEVFGHTLKVTCELASEMPPAGMTRQVGTCVLFLIPGKGAPTKTEKLL